MCMRWRTGYALREGSTQGSAGCRPSARVQYLGIHHRLHHRRRRLFLLATKLRRPAHPQSTGSARLCNEAATLPLPPPPSAGQRTWSVLANWPDDDRLGGPSLRPLGPKVVVVPLGSLAGPPTARRPPLPPTSHGAFSPGQPHTSPAQSGSRGRVSPWHCYKLLGNLLPGWPFHRGCCKSAGSCLTSKPGRRGTHIPGWAGVPGFDFAARLVYF